MSTIILSRNVIEWHAMYKISSVLKSIITVSHSVVGLYSSFALILSSSDDDTDWMTNAVQLTSTSVRSYRKIRDCFVELCIKLELILHIMYHL